MARHRGLPPEAPTPIETTELTTRVLQGEHTRTSLGPSGELLFLTLLDPLDDGSSRAREPRHMLARAGSPHHHQVTSVYDDTPITLRLEPAPCRYDFAQPLPDGGWIAVNSGSRGPDDPNAFVHDNTGHFVRSFYAGDGIEDCVTTASGRLWVSYFDEGILGNQPLSSHGLVCLDAQGGTEYAFAPYSMMDCYALNVAAEEDAWCCYYTGFPLVRVRAGLNEDVLDDAGVHGSSAFAVRHGAVLFAGSYDDHHTLFRVELDSRRITPFVPVDADGDEITGFHGVARGPKMLLIKGRTIREVNGPW